MGTNRKRLQPPRQVQLLLGQLAFLPEPADLLPVLVDPLLEPVAELAEPVAGPVELVAELVVPAAEPAELADPLPGQLPELVHFQVAMLLVAEPAEPAAGPVELVAELAELVAELAELVAELAEPVAGPVVLVAGPVVLDLELVGPVAELVRRLRKILRPQTGFPERIARRRLQAPESQADFRQIPEPPAPLPPGIAARPELFGFALPPVGLVDFGRCLGFLGPIR